MLKKVLIVDDEPNVAMMLSESLEALGEDYIFEVAHSGLEALEKIQAIHYTIVITDYNMPDLTGLELTEAIRDIAPDTQVVLITGHGTDDIRRTAKKLQVDGYLDKPFSIKQIRAVVQHAINQTRQPKQAPTLKQQGLDGAAYDKLKTLQSYTGAQSVLLITTTGYPVAEIGHTDKLDVTTVATLVAANFLAAAELARMLDSEVSIFKSSYYEGDNYNIYSYDVNKQFLLVVIFDARSKPGVVWFYTKQAAAELSPMLVDQTKQFKWKAEDDVADTLEADLNELLGL